MALHRAVFLRLHGYLPEVVMHTCDNPRCINPAHLVAGTQSDNIRDCVAKGRYKRNLTNRYTAAQIEAIRMDTRKHKDIARAYGCDPSLVSRIKSGVYYVP